MNVGELKRMICDLPPETDVFIKDCCCGDDDLTDIDDVVYTKSLAGGTANNNLVLYINS
jgi:hypothetical protein